MVALVGQVEVDTDLQPVGNLAVDVRTDGVAVHVGERLDTFAAESAQRDVIVTALAAARHAEVGLPGGCVLVEDPLAPVGADVVVQTELLQILELGVGLEARIRQFAELKPLGRGHQLHRELSQVGNTVGSADRDGRFLAGTLLGGDVNHTVGRTRTIDGGGGCVLHDRHILDIVRVEGREDGHIHRGSIEDEERSVGCIDGVHTAQTHGNRCARLTGTGVNLQTGDLTLEGVTGTCGRNLGKGIRFDQRSGTDHGTDLLGGTVRYDYGLFQHVRIRLESRIDDALSTHRDFIIFEAHGGEDKNCIFGHAVKNVVSVGIRGDTFHGALYHNAGKGDRLTVFRRNNLAGDPVLCQQCATGEQHHGKD